MKKQISENYKTVNRFQKLAGLLTESYASHNVDSLGEKKFDEIVWEVGNKLSVDENEAWKIVNDMIGNDVNKDKRAWDMYHNMSITAEEVADYIVQKVQGK